MTDDQTIEAPAIEEAPGHPLESLIPELKIADRCCACNAQAFVAVLLTSDNEHALLFCGHHYAKNEAALHARDPFAVRDERHKINQTSASSA